VGIVTARKADTDQLALAIDARAALGVLGFKPATITDPRLDPEPETAGYVRDSDDPPYILGRRYTYGTSESAHSLRTAGWVSASVGAGGVIFSWFTYRSTRNPSPGARDRFVVVNDLCWGLLALGAIGVGVSYALPEAHEFVPVNVAARPRSQIRVGLTLTGLSIGAEL
jgi:hypothetical protein